MFIYFWVGEGQRERETQNPKQLQALSCQHRARHGAWTHDLQNHDLSRSRTLNPLSHPGAPAHFIFKEDTLRSLSCPSFIRHHQQSHLGICLNPKLLSLNTIFRVRMLRSPFYPENAVFFFFFFFFFCISTEERWEKALQLEHDGGHMETREIQIRS